MPHTIAIFGSINMDLVMRVTRVPGPGETLSGESFFTVPGGKGSNQAVAVARLGKSSGITAAMIGCVGDDAFGAQMQDSLANDSVNLNHLTVCENTSTGVALIMVEANGQNRIVLAEGANGKLSPASADRAEETIRNSALLMCQLETPLPGIEHVLEIAKRHHVPVVLNPAPAIPLPSSILDKVDYLIPNESEAALLSGLPVTDTTSAMEAAVRLLTMGPKNVLITLGEQGVLLATSDGICEILPAFRVDPVDTTAAGDTFIGGLAVGLAERLDIRKAIHLGQKAAAIGVTRSGAQTSIPFRHEAEAFGV